MKLLRVGEHGNEIPAIIDNQNNFRNLSNILKDFTPENLNFENLDKIKKLDLNSLPLIESTKRIGHDFEKMVENESKSICIDQFQ